MSEDNTDILSNNQNNQTISEIEQEGDLKRQYFHTST